MPNTNQHVNPVFAGILNHFAAPKAPTCECDGELVWDEYPSGGYVKTSHYCPLCDDCDCCGEVKGVKKDRTLTVAGRPAWVCEECYLLCDDHGEKDCKICAAAVKPEVWYA